LGNKRNIMKNKTIGTLIEYAGVGLVLFAVALGSKIPGLSNEIAKLFFIPIVGLAFILMIIWAVKIYKK